MANQRIKRCAWLVDTIRRYGRVTRSQLEEAWEHSQYYEGKAFSRRTFCSHREMAEELFNVTIACDPKTFEYYIDDSEGNMGSVTAWLLDSVSMNDMLVGAHEITDRIFVENVPSAREFLSTVIDALKERHPIKFDYHPYTRTLPTKGIVVEPYFLKLFKQRWYMVGRVPAEDRVKTYALDRVKNANILSDTTFEDDPAFDIEGYFKYSYGIVVTHNEPRKIVLKVSPKRAKYLRALPFHESQSETVSDKYSLFTYFMRITDDFVSELLSYGPEITVVEPQELRAIVISSLRESLKNYTDKNNNLNQTNA